MCAVLVDKLTEEQLEELAAEVREQLGAPSSADQVQMRLGDEDGSRSTLTLEGPGGTVEMSVFFSTTGTGSNYDVAELLAEHSP